MVVDEYQFIKRRGLAMVSESEDEKFEDEKSEEEKEYWPVRLRKNSRSREAEKHAKTKRAAKDSGARGSNDPAPRIKIPVQELEGPTSPEKNRKAARSNWKS